MSMLGKRTHAESTMDAERKHVDDVQEASTTDCFLTTMEERMVDCDVTAFLAKKTLPHPEDMPLQYSYSGDTFYVRACYPVDYDKIMDCFQEEDVSGLTLTGSTGVGTSVFMAYFFLRYTLEHPKATIVMTAFAANSNIAEAAVWKDGRFESKNNYVDGIGNLSWQFRDDPDVLFLINEPPNLRPKEHQYIVFTCREEKWFRCVRKDSTHSWMDMPPWHETELVDAVDKLALHSKLGRLKRRGIPTPS